MRDVDALTSQVIHGTLMVRVCHSAGFSSVALSGSVVDSAVASIVGAGSSAVRISSGRGKIIALPMPSAGGGVSSALESATRQAAPPCVFSRNTRAGNALGPPPMAISHILVANPAIISSLPICSSFLERLA
jgi:hypothetical protein